MKQFGASLRVRGVKESEEFLNELENQIKPLVEAARKK
jgi:hypothetical protein